MDEEVRELDSLKDQSTPASLLGKIEVFSEKVKAKWKKEINLHLNSKYVLDANEIEMRADEMTSNEMTYCAILMFCCLSRPDIVQRFNTGCTWLCSAT